MNSRSFTPYAILFIISRGLTTNLLMQLFTNLLISYRRCSEPQPYWFHTNTSADHKLVDFIQTRTSGNHKLTDFIQTHTSGNHKLTDFIQTHASGNHKLTDFIQTHQFNLPLSLGFFICPHVHFIWLVCLSLKTQNTLMYISYDLFPVSYTHLTLPTSVYV